MRLRISASQKTAWVMVLIFCTIAIPTFAEDIPSGESSRRLPSGRPRPPTQRPTPEKPMEGGTNIQPSEKPSSPPSAETPTSSSSPSTDVPSSSPSPDPKQADEPSNSIQTMPSRAEETPTKPVEPSIPLEAPLTAPLMSPSETDTSPSPAAAPQAEPLETTPERRLPSGRARPAPTRPDVEPAIGGLTAEQAAEYERSNFIPIRDRWRIAYGGGLLDPYAQNLLKADYPIIGQDVFLNVVAISDSLFEARKLPTAQGISREQPGNPNFFGQGNQIFFNQNFVASFEIFKGSTAFRPRDWAVRVTPVFNINFLDVQERNVVNIDVRNGTTRTRNFIGFQEAFVEAKLLDISKNFDFVSTRVGIQGFTSDFRGFILSDNEPGIRFFGNFGNNRYQWNIAYFQFLEKETNSMLNSFHNRNRGVVVANVFKQDFLFQGYTTQLSFHHDRDDAGDHGQQYDKNGFLVRPARIGDLQPHNVRSYYLGWAGDGHIGRFNLSHAFYQVFGDVSHDPIAGQKVSINAQLAAAELSYDIDWLRPKVSVLYASGDRNPTDGTARGFDSILDNVNFAGSGFSFFNRQGIALTQTGVFLVNRFSLLNDFRSSKIQGQAEFVNPGIIVANAGLDAEITPKLKAVANFNYLWFAATEPLQYVLHQPKVRSTIGADYSLGFIYRPLLNQNIVLTGGFAYFTPGGGFKDIQVSDNLYSAFFSATLTF